MAEWKGFNADEHKSRNLFPEGRYKFRIFKSEIVDAVKDGVNIGSDWVFDLICISPQQTNRQMKKHFAYERHSNADNIREQVRIAAASLADICRAVGVVNPKHHSDLNGKDFEADVKIKGEFNNLAKIKAVSGGAPLTRPATTEPIFTTKPQGW